MQQSHWKFPLFTITITFPNETRFNNKFNRAHWNYDEVIMETGKLCDNIRVTAFLLADIFLYSYETEFLQSLLSTGN